MYCLQCGTRLPDDAAFCSSCGIRQRAPDSNPSPSATSNHKGDRIHPIAQVVIVLLGFLYDLFRLALTLVVGYMIVGSFLWGPSDAWGNLTTFVGDKAGGIQERLSIDRGESVGRPPTTSNRGGSTSVQQSSDDSAECEGYDSWYRAMEKRMTDLTNQGLRVLSGEVTSRTEGEKIARAIDQIAVSQRASNPPPAAVELNDLLVESALLSAERVRASLGTDASEVNRLNVESKALVDDVTRAEARLREECG